MGLDAGLFLGTFGSVMTGDLQRFSIGGPVSNQMANYFPLFACLPQKHIPGASMLAIFHHIKS